jgi:DNA polymerase-3 subunit delta'
MFKDFLPPLVDDVNHTPPFYGHEKLFEKFLHSLQAQTLHHAWLLTGPQGIGKATAAKILARFLLRHADDSYPTEIPLSEPEDAIGRQTLEGTHPDFILIEKGEEGLSASKNFITIDAVRHVTQSIQQTSSHNGWKVVIVDSLDDMNEKAQNALLKSLEEPSQKTIFFLINHTASTLSPTIRSRCQEVKLQPLSPVLMEAFIKSNHLALTDAEKNLLILMAKGRLGIG